jgi:hypothetical protein
VLSSSSTFDIEHASPIDHCCRSCSRFSKFIHLPF